MAKNEYVIYQCIGKNKEGKKLERIFKLPSFWTYELLGIALATLSDDVIKIEVMNEGCGYTFGFYDKASSFGPEFRDLIDTDLEFTLYDINKNSTHFICKKIGSDNVKNNITRTTPIVISCNDIIDYEKRTRILFNLEREKFMFD